MTAEQDTKPLLADGYAPSLVKMGRLLLLAIPAVAFAGRLNSSSNPRATRPVPGNDKAPSVTNSIFWNSKAKTALDKIQCRFFNALIRL